MRRISHSVAVVAIAGLACLPVVRAASLLSAEARGYRLIGYRWDSVLGQRWAVFQAGGHPEWPLLSELAPGDGAGGNAPAPLLAAQAQAQAQPVIKAAELLVRSGETVTLWRDESNVRMQLLAVSEANGVLGQRVQLRVTGAGIFGSTGWRTTGVVRGPGSVEME